MTETIATTPGLFPLPDWAKTRLGRLKGHQKHDLIDGSESAEVLETYEQARGEVIDAQRDAGIDRIVEGQLRWDDMLAHPLTINPAVETGGMLISGPAGEAATGTVYVGDHDSPLRARDASPGDAQ